MRRKHLWLTVLLLTILSLTVTACGDKSPTVAPAVKLERESLTLEVGSTFVLTPTVTDWDGAVEWESDDASVVAVADGTLTAVSVGGPVTVRAKAGTASAECAVTVVAPSEVGTLSIGYEKIELLKDRRLTLAPVLIYKGAAVEGVSYTFGENSEGKVVALENVTAATVTVSAIGVGDAIVTVSCTHLGITLTDTVAVKVSPDVVFTVEGLDYGKNGYEVQLVPLVPKGYENAYKNCFTPEVQVAVGGQPIAGDYTLRIPATAQSGVATATGKRIEAAGVGDTTVEIVFTAANQNEYVFPISVNVRLAEVEEQIAFDFEQYDDSGEIVSEFLENSTVRKVLIGNEQLDFDSTEDGKIAVSGLDGLTTGEYALTVQCDNLIYTAKATLVTKVLRTKADLDALDAMSKVDGTPKWTGYFVLGNDIEYNARFASFCGYDQGTEWNDQYGFVGTFDGRGHAIIGMRIDDYWACGMFGTVGAAGVVRNVSFIDAELTSNSLGNGIVAGFVHGLIENVFVDVENYAASNSAGIAYYVFWTGKVRNCVVYARNASAGEGNCSLISQSSVSPTTEIRDCYSVGSYALYRTGGDNPTPGPESNTLKNFQTFAEMDAANLTLADRGWNTDTMWDVSAGVPIAKAYKTYLANGAEELAIPNDNTQAVHNTLTLSGGDDWIYTIKTPIEGISVSGNVVTIEKNYGKQFTVVATYRYDADVTAEKTFTVGNELVELTQSVDMELSAENYTVVIDALADATVNKAVVGATELTIEKQNGASLTLSGYGALPYGDYTLLLTSDAETKDFSAPVSLVTKILRTKDDVDKLNELSRVDGENKWDGYFVLGNDIDYNDLSSVNIYDAPNKYTPFGVYADIGDDVWNSGCGFLGTFDGRGHIIKGFKYSGNNEGGLFGTIGGTGVVRNVGFVKSRLDWTGEAGIVAMYVHGLVENVFVEVEGSGWGASGAIAGALYWTGNVRNCMAIMYDGYVEGNTWSVLIARTYDGCVLENCYGISTLSSPLYNTGGDNPTPGAESNTLKKFGSEQEMKDAGLALAGWNDTIWDTSSGVPVFKGAI